ncbi:YesL family protein [Brachybacterium sp. FME24]|uniref:YesL family protein n=1 Tax=Brachybacterium sp. FME24 TaxID=2742605 RepID=UPI0018688655|nr:YesL family protein [Brachybacterium sp. FME24]
MFGFEQFVTLNRGLTGFWRFAWLNILWIVVTVLGLGVLGAGPASYAMAKYLDRWFRHGETPPAAPTFFRYARELRWHPVLVGGVLLAAGAVILVNLMSLPDWYLRVANLLALAVLWIITAHVFFVMAALDVQGLRAQLSSALLLGLGSLHWTIIGTAVVLAGYALMIRFALPLLALFGVALPAVVFAAICRRTVRDLDLHPATTPSSAPDLPRIDAHPAGRTDALSRRSPSASDRATTLRKGTPA